MTPEQFQEKMEVLMFFQNMVLLVTVTLIALFL